VRVLIAEDDAISRRLLEANLRREGYDVLAVETGLQAWEALRAEGAPRLAVLDWMMPEMDGAEICRRVREDAGLEYVYLILLTARGRKEDRALGFDAGADDYLTKPFDSQDLRARISAGRRILDLQSQLTEKIDELEDALCQVRQLQGLLPICMHCKKIRDEESDWHQLEVYIERHSEANFTHSLCPACMAHHYPEIHQRFVDRAK
jgi:sigma-B regulation protein RsbU (phosphoserine phosphatase)